MFFVFSSIKNVLFKNSTQEFEVFFVLHPLGVLDIENLRKIVGFAINTEKVEHLHTSNWIQSV